MDENQINLISEKIIGCAYNVHNKLGNGFLEKIYEKALFIELAKIGLKVESQKAINVYYDDTLIGEFFADLLVEDKIIIELKAVAGFNDNHFAQCLNYLKATKLPLCLLINFGKTRVEVKRFRR